MIRPREITLALISKLTVVKLAQKWNSFGLKTVFRSLRGERSKVIRSDFCTCPFTSALKVPETPVTQLIASILINNNSYSTYFSKSASLSNDGCRKLGEHEGHFSSALWSPIFQKSIITQLTCKAVKN